MKKLTFYLLTLLFFKIGYTKNIDSLLMVKVHAVFDSIYNQNYINDTKGLSELNNYLIDINTDEFNTYEVNEFLNTKVFAVDDANTIKAISENTKIQIRNRLLQINTKTKNISNEVYTGVQFYLMLISGIPISIESEPPPGKTLGNIISNYDDKQYFDMCYVVANKKTKITETTNYAVDKELIIASKNVLKELNNLRVDVNCKTYAQQANYTKKPFYIFSIIDLIVTENYKSQTATNEALTIKKEIKRVNLYYKYTDGITNKINCNGQSIPYDIKVDNAFKTLHEFIRTYQLQKSDNSQNKDDATWNKILSDYTTGFEIAQDNYLDMLALSVDASSLIEDTKNCIIGVNAEYQSYTPTPTSKLFGPNFHDEDICLCGLRSNFQFNNTTVQNNFVLRNKKTNLFEQVMNINITGLKLFTKEQRVTLLKLLTAPKDNEGYPSDNDITNVITNIVQSFTTKDEAVYLIQELSKPNEIARNNNYSLLACIEQIVKNDKTDLDGQLIGGAFMYQFNNALINIFNIANQELINDELKIFGGFSTPEQINEYLTPRAFVHSPIINENVVRFLPDSDIRFRANNLPVGTCTYKLIEYNKATSKLKIEKTILKGWERKDENGFKIISIPYRDNNGSPQLSRKRVVTDIRIDTIENHDFAPFDMVYFIASPEGQDLPSLLAQNNVTQKGNFLIGPAYILKYKYEVERSINIRKNSNKEDYAIDMGLNALMLVAPELKVLSKLSFFFRAKSIININRLIQLGAVSQMTSNTINQISNGFGSEKDKVTKFIENINLFLGAGYLLAGGTDFYMAYRIAKNQRDFLTKGAAVLKEFYEEEANLAMRNAVKSGSADVKANANAMWDVVQYIDDYAIKILKQSKGWYVEYGHSILNPQFGETYAYNKLLSTNFFTENAIQRQILDGINGTPIVSGIVAKEEVTINLMINAVTNSYDEFKLIKGVKALENGTVALKDLIVAKGATKAGILNTLNYSANELTVAALNKMGVVYEEAGVASGLKKVLEEYKKMVSGATNTIKEEKAIADLLPLINGKVSVTDLKNFFKYIGNDGNRANQFAKDINQYALLDDFVKEGKLLDFYTALKKNDYTFNSFESLFTKQLKNYSSFQNFAAKKASIKIKGDIGVVYFKEFIQAQKMGQELGKDAAFFKESQQGIEGYFIKEGQTKIPFSLKYTPTNNVKNVFREINDNADYIMKGFNKNDNFITTYCKFSSEANTNIRVDVQNFTKSEILTYFNSIPVDRRALLFGQSGVFKEIKIIDKNGLALTFDNNYNLIN